MGVSSLIQRHSVTNLVATFPVSALIPLTRKKVVCKYTSKIECCVYFTGIFSAEVFGGHRWHRRLLRSIEKICKPTPGTAVFFKGRIKMSLIMLVLNALVVSTFCFSSLKKVRIRHLLIEGCCS